ncbi:hypothetical protein ABIB94_007893 [Bradyrhizobium sp. JR7.2]
MRGIHNDESRDVASWDDLRQARAARKRHREIAPVLNEQGLRRFVAQEAKALGHGGGSLMSGINGLARSTIYPLLAAGLLVSVGHGLSDIRDNGAVPAGPVRKAGGGHKKKSSRDPTLAADLKRLVEPVTRGDPMQPLLWTTRNLVTELAKEGHKVCPGVVSELLRGRGYSCKRTTRHEKAASTSIATRSFNTSTRRPRRSWRRTNRSYRSTRRRRN